MNNAFNRRQFFGLTFASAVAGSVFGHPVIAIASTEMNHNIFTKPAIDNDHLVVTSSAGLGGHRHQIRIPLEVFESSEEIQEYVSSKAAFHHHSIHLSGEQVAEIAAGQSVTVPDSQWGEHDFEIYFPKDNE